MRRTNWRAPAASATRKMSTNRLLSAESSGQFMLPLLFVPRESWASYLSPAYATRCLEEALAPETMFDQGYENTFALLSEADDKLINWLSSLETSEKQLRPGRLSQDDSKRFLGLQAADIAAAVARDVFEENYEDARTGAEAVREIFPKVMLNDEWFMP